MSIARSDDVVDDNATAAAAAAAGRNDCRSACPISAGVRIFYAPTKTKARTNRSKCPMSAETSIAVRRWSHLAYFAESVDVRVGWSVEWGNIIIPVDYFHSLELGAIQIFHWHVHVICRYAVFE